MYKCDLTSFHVKSRAGKPMKVMDEGSEVYFNFINSLHSDSTKTTVRILLVTSVLTIGKKVEVRKVVIN